MRGRDPKSVGQKFPLLVSAHCCKNLEILEIRKTKISEWVHHYLRSYVLAEMNSCNSYAPGGRMYQNALGDLAQGSCKGQNVTLLDFSEYLQCVTNCILRRGRRSASLRRPTLLISNLTAVKAHTTLPRMTLSEVEDKHAQE